LLTKGLQFTADIILGIIKGNILYFLYIYVIFSTSLIVDQLSCLNLVFIKCNVNPMLLNYIRRFNQEP